MPTPPYYKPLKPRMTRRAFFCDYRAPGFFMITITAAAGTPPLGHLSTDSCTPQIILSPLGELIRQSIENFTANTPEIRIPTYIIMPDHFHMLLHVRQRLPRHLGRIIGAFKGGNLRPTRTTCGRPGSDTAFQTQISLQDSDQTGTA